MFIKSIIVLSAAMILAAASASAEDRGLPNLDIQRHCRAAQGATDETLGEKTANTVDSCVIGEQRAREKLVRDWQKITASEKASCVQPIVYSPSYMEWISCLETEAFLEKIRKEHPDSTATSKLCPTVKLREDGSVASVLACNSMQNRL